MGACARESAQAQACPLTQSYAPHQSDCTTRESKNQYLFDYLAHLVYKNKFKITALLNPRPGHSHAIWGCVSKNVRYRMRVRVPCLFPSCLECPLSSFGFLFRVMPVYRVHLSRGSDTNKRRDTVVAIRPSVETRDVRIQIRGSESVPRRGGRRMRVYTSGISNPSVWHSCWALLCTC